MPEDELAIQVCYSLHDEETVEREKGALAKLPKRLACRRRIILTFDEETSFTDQYGTIEVIPCWKWMLSPFYPVLQHKTDVPKQVVRLSL